MSPTPAALDQLLAALRLAEVGVGPRELLRLQAVFRAGPRLRPAPQPGDDAHRRRLRAIVGAALITRPEDRQPFAQVFDAWYDQAIAELNAGAPAPRPAPVARPSRQARATTPAATPAATPTAAPSAAPPAAKPRRHLRWLLALLAVELLLGAGLRIWPPQPPAPAAPIPIVEPDRDVAPEPTPVPSAPPADYGTHRPSILVEPAPSEWRRWPGWPPALLGAITLLAGVLAGYWVMHRSRLSAPVDGPPQPGGPPQRFLPGPPSNPGLLLDPAEQGRLVWGIGRYVTDQPTDRLDLPATVRASARQGGLAVPRFLPAQRHRAVWLWTDTTAPVLAEQLADGLAGVLGAHGLAVERARFRMLPDALADADGEPFGPREVEARRAGALICIFSDGRRLLRRWRSPAERPRIAALLRLLGHWPRLTWVDLGDGALAALLQEHGLVCIGPDQLVDRLASPPDAAPPPPRPAASGPARAHQRWAAACALPFAPIEPADALALRRQLAADCPPWELPRLQAEAPGPGGRLHWPPARRAALLGWLGALAAPDGADSDPLRRALDYWDRRYAALLAEPGPDTEARRRSRAERALLWLWQRPAEAAAELHRLAGGDRRGSTADFVRVQLRGLHSADSPAADPGCIRLPWRWNALGVDARLLLAQLGFGCGRLRRKRPRLAGRGWLGLGLLAGLGGGALLIALAQPPATRELGAPRIVHQAPAGLDPRHRLSRDAAGRWQLTAFSRDQLVHTAAADAPELSAGRRVTVAWQAERRPCIARLADGAELHRCAGTAPRAEAPYRRLAVLAAAPYRRLAVLAAAPDSPGVAELAAALLRGGSAHQVLIDPDWPQRWPVLAGHTPELHPDDQLLLLSPAGAPANPAQLRDRLGDAVGLWLKVADWGALTRKLAELPADDWQSAAERWPGLPVVFGERAAVDLAGIGTADCRPMQWTDSAHGIDYIDLCGGEFLMGSPEDEPDRDNDETQHPVRVSPFALARTETTNAQYRTVYPDHEGADALPVVRVSWDEAAAFCREAGGARLPTEAEWEYAARAGTTTRWSFGDDEARLGEYAWYSENSGDEAHEVDTKQPNPWGLADMYGNVYEWVADRYGPYEDSGEVQVDPTGPASGVSRVLRGGAFFFRAWDLRSAFRFRYWPENRDGDIGFRCARVPAASIDP